MSSEENSNNGAAKRISPTHLNQILVLKSMDSLENGTPEPRAFQIEEIAERSGLVDEREIQRYLYQLEGQKLVSPHPEGDFTSKTWQITKHGQRALKTIQGSLTF